MRVVFCVNRDDVALETRRVPRAVVAVLALIDSPLFLSFANDYSHTAGQTGCTHSALCVRSTGGSGCSLFRRRYGSMRLCPLNLGLFRRGLLFFRVDRQDVTAENKGICIFVVTMPTLMEFLGSMRHRVLLQFRRSVEAFPTNGTFVWIVLGVNRYDMAFQVTGIGTFVITVGTKVGLILFVR